MIFDLQALGTGTFDADVCIVGAGAAGITLARSLAASGLSVVLLEGGGLSPDAQTQSLYAGDVAGQPYSLETSRLRYFGGSTGHWEGFCGLFDESDFQVRDWVPLSGWAIERDTLVPFWQRAHDILDLGPFQYGVPDHEKRAPAFRSLESCFWRNSPPTRFSPKYREEIERSDDITCLLHANLLRLQGANGGRVVQRATIGALGRPAVSINARSFVLACGGIENARLLLIAAQRRDLRLNRVAARIGRYFMEHVLVPGNATVVATSDWWQNYQRLVHEGFSLTPGLRVSDDLQRERKILNVAGMLRPTDCPAGITDRVCLELFTICEQAPNPESRVTLAPRTDALGLPMVKLDWRLTDLEQRTIATAALLFAQEIGRLGLGRTRIQNLGSELPETIWAANHHMGTTRMGDDGVVDRDCRVQGIENLFVAGSSVFPTGGYINPTLTIVALSLRLAEHLAMRF